MHSPRPEVPLPRRPRLTPAWLIASASALACAFAPEPSPITTPASAATPIVSVKPDDPTALGRWTSRNGGAEVVRGDLRVEVISVEPDVVDEVVHLRFTSPGMAARERTSIAFTFADVSPDGRWVVLDTARGIEIYDPKIDVTWIVEPTPGYDQAHAFAWSPDGAAVAWSEDDGVGTRVRVADPAARTVAEAAAGGHIVCGGICLGTTPRWEGASALAIAEPPRFATQAQAAAWVDDGRPWWRVARYDAALRPLPDAGTTTVAE